MIQRRRLDVSVSDCVCVMQAAAAALFFRYEQLSCHGGDDEKVNVKLMHA